MGSFSRPASLVYATAAAVDYGSVSEGLTEQDV